LYRDELFEPTVWLSWEEAWRSLGQDRFRLEGASWTFYWGSYHLEDKHQIVRAEWDNPDPRGDAPQPHWHVDRDILATVYPQQSTLPGLVGQDGELQEVRPPAALVELEVAGPGPCPALQDVGLSGVHLAMGGWQNHPGGHPECWQCAMGDLSHLVDWATRVLDHARAEFRRLRAGKPEWV